jgi:hypothetical protein
MAVQFVEWQEAFDQGRRRQKPKSAGVLLKIRKDILKSYIEDKHLKVCYTVNMKRSTDKYSPEEEMDWKYFKQVHQLEA